MLINLILELQQHKPIETHEPAQATQIPRPTKSKYDFKLAVNKSITVEHCKDRQLIMYPNCNISFNWRAQQGWIHLKLGMLQPEVHNASKTCKQVGKQIQETVKYCNEQYKCTG